MSKALIDRFLTKGLRHGLLRVHFADGETRTYGTPAPGFPEVTVRFADTRVPRDIVFDPRLGAAECFMEGRLLVESGEIMELVELLRANSPWDKGGNFGRTGLFKRLLNTVAFAAEQVNGAISSRRNVAHHYDIGNALYQLMLETEHMQYSCAYWPDAARASGMTLEQAQAAKLAHIAAKLALVPGQRVLDIGCGWGGMSIYLAQKCGVSVVGITLSQEQLELAEERAALAGVTDLVRFELVDYRDYAAAGHKFDRIVSVGMFEHVGRAQFATFFRACTNLLTDDGVMLLHTIGRMGTPGTTDAFTRKYIFPGGYIPALSETLAASEPCRLIATDIETLRLHYAFTLRDWYCRCLAHEQEITLLFDARFFRMWIFYLAGATAAFEHGGMCNYQIQYARNRRALPLDRNYIATEEQALLHRDSGDRALETC